MSTQTVQETETIAPQAPLVCAYVITYDGKRFLDRCFETLQQLTDYENYQLIVVDNGSSDGSGVYVRQNFPDIDIVRVFPNFGYAHGANAAIEDARRRGAKYVVLMNDDIAILYSQWLREAISHFEQDPSIGLIGLEQIVSEDEQHALPEGKLTDVDYVGSPVMLMPVELFDRIGGFDEVYFVMGDDDDLTARAQAAGYRTATLDIPVYHFGGGTNQSFSRRTAYLQMRNGIRFSLKNRSVLHALLRAARNIDLACNPWPLTFDASNGAHRNIRNSGNVAVNMVLWMRAVGWNLVRLPETFRMRAAERRLIAAARASRKSASVAPPPWVDPGAAEQLTY